MGNFEPVLGDHDIATRMDLGNVRTETPPVVMALACTPFVLGESFLAFLATYSSILINLIAAIHYKANSQNWKLEIPAWGNPGVSYCAAVILKCGIFQEGQ